MSFVPSARRRAVFCVLLPGLGVLSATTAACGARSDVLGWMDPIGTSGSEEAGTSSRGSAASEDAASGNGLPTFEDGGTDLATACLGKGNAFVLVSDTASIIRAPYVVTSASVMVDVLWRVDGLPSYIGIWTVDPNGFQAEFSTEPIPAPLLPGTYKLGPGTRSPTMEVAVRGEGLGGAGSFQVLEMQATPVPGDTSDAPDGLSTFTAVFDLPIGGFAGCVHVEL